MKRTIFIALMLLLASSAALAQDYGLPELHTIKTATLSPNYGCRSQEDFSRGYETTALFLSDYSKRRNAPDLLFNGACKSEDYFQASTAGDDMALIADLGTDVSIEQLSAHLAFNKQNVHSFPAYSKFAQAVKVEANHTYVVLLNKSDLRGLFIFTVTSYVPNERVKLKYAVKEYQVLDVKAESPGFSWGQENATTQAEASAVKEESKKQN
ncbi:MAG TPA: hypothetical protein VKB86_10630 [Pyrinomonadaceae bacterium]|nr:hypothetical protein [Pyrinomonadaceae bacterium]